jgi:hypothetical protein
MQNFWMVRKAVNTDTTVLEGFKYRSTFIKCFYKPSEKRDKIHVANTQCQYNLQGILLSSSQPFA